MKVVVRAAIAASVFFAGMYWLSVMAEAALDPEEELEYLEMRRLELIGYCRNPDIAPRARRAYQREISWAEQRIEELHSSPRPRRSERLAAAIGSSY